MRIPFLHRSRATEESSETYTLIETLLNEKEPFHSLNKEEYDLKELAEPVYDESNDDLATQPPTTKAELMTYYLYYNGVNYTIVKQPSFTKRFIYRTMGLRYTATCQSYFSI